MQRHWQGMLSPWVRVQACRLWISVVPDQRVLVVALLAMGLVSSLIARAQNYQDFLTMARHLRAHLRCGIRTVIRLLRLTVGIQRVECFQKLVLTVHL